MTILKCRIEVVGPQTFNFKWGLVRYTPVLLTKIEVDTRKRPQPWCSVTRKKDHYIGRTGIKAI